jgi:hypothetical protein
MRRSNESTDGTQCYRFRANAAVFEASNPMSELSDVASGVTPVSPDEDAPNRPASENLSDPAPGDKQIDEKQTRALEDAENVDGRVGAEEARGQFDDNLRAAKENISRLASDQKIAGAHRISGLARAVHGAADNLEPDLPQAAESLREAAAALERASTALKERSVVDLMDGVGTFARAQPVAFFGGTVLAGLVLARFLKSSTEPRPTATTHE